MAWQNETLNYLPPVAPNNNPIPRRAHNYLVFNQVLPSNCTAAAMVMMLHYKLGRPLAIGMAQMWLRQHQGNNNAWWNWGNVGANMLTLHAVLTANAGNFQIHQNGLPNVLQGCTIAQPAIVGIQWHIPPPQPPQFHVTVCLGRPPRPAPAVALQGLPAPLNYPELVFADSALGVVAYEMNRQPHNWFYNCNQNSFGIPGATGTIIAAIT